MMKCPHIMKTVCQFDEQHTNVFRHRKNKLPEILGLFGLIALQLDPR